MYKTAQKITGCQRRVLIMDDDELILEVAGCLLRKLGFIVAVARNGDEALAKYEHGMSLNKPFDVVIVDLAIPNGMNGSETIERLQQCDPKAVIIVSSGDILNPLISDYKKFGLSGRIIKPYQLTELKKIIDDIFINEPQTDHSNKLTAV